MAPFAVDPAIPSPVEAPVSSGATVEGVVAWSADQHVIAVAPPPARYRPRLGPIGLPQLSPVDAVVGEGEHRPVELGEAPGF